MQTLIKTRLQVMDNCEAHFQYSVGTTIWYRSQCRGRAHDTDHNVVPMSMIPFTIATPWQAFRS